MKSLHVEGSGWLYQLSPRIKLASLALFSIGLFLTRDPFILFAAVLVAGLVLWQTHLGVREIVARLRPVLLTIAIIAAFSFLLISAVDAAIALLRLTALTLLATAITASVSISQFMDEIAFALRPLEKLGLAKAADVGLAVGLVVRFVPEVINRYETLRDAHRARGMKTRLHTILVPLIIMTLKDADAIADAIDARGFRGQTSSSDL
ncbi:CbiQ family ECF transporter T component [Agrobacterium rosae]|uniref:Transporter n=1 Tax=Agrobacterium rosae TaxID=1972867 RepID=A0AAE5RXF3_9HYPH|nr:energy-coupling factor transporter transmembrane protein EcfT [Agrobacterium rosae]KAA3514213.1 energy-coupling factor transporter transmembrane protein EcfT [Agrobacterium rosae]KAA3522880.1 energy-coupling factor transporter transmembrane protein EcfT [Agrobacterium rosae]MCM2433833.1 energy-coupling factor transporter transmembrane protein EcfT [Agrobacterium rosae]MDX8330611.1 energy-coupling factor transporter transmembrane protein EcfT [Agrobacterium rosae]MQB47572.1 energy-coupling f